MNLSKLLSAAIILLLLASCKSHTTNKEDTVNALIGDISFVETLGFEPSLETNETLRLQTHLQYVEQVLRKKDMSKLPKMQQINRYKMLDLLHTYWKAGNFPRNYDHPNQRIPCFIDKEGNICAVGYLIEQTAGRQIAEAINTKYQYAYISAMNDQTVDSWVMQSGLTKEECGMIQPTYGPQPQPGTITINNITPAYGVSSAIMGGVNVTLNALNGIQLVRGTTHKSPAIIGLVTGTGQIIHGALNFPKTQSTWNGPVVNASQRNLSMINIGIGTSTLLLSGWNLITQRKPKDKTVSLNMYSFPTPENNMGIGFNLTKRL